MHLNQTRYITYFLCRVHQPQYGSPSIPASVPIHVSHVVYWPQFSTRILNRQDTLLTFCAEYTSHSMGLHPSLHQYQYTSHTCGILTTILNTHLNQTRYITYFLCRVHQPQYGSPSIPASVPIHVSHVVYWPQFSTRILIRLYLLSLQSTPATVWVSIHPCISTNTRLTCGILTTILNTHLNQTRYITYFLCRVHQPQYGSPSIPASVPIHVSHVVYWPQFSTRILIRQDTLLTFCAEYTSHSMGLHPSLHQYQYTSHMWYTDHNSQHASWSAGKTLIKILIIKCDIQAVNFTLTIKTWIHHKNTPNVNACNPCLTCWIPFLNYFIKGDSHNSEYSCSILNIPFKGTLNVSAGTAA